MIAMTGNGYAKVDFYVQFPIIDDILSCCCFT